MIVARKVAAGIAEIASLGLFLGMVWVWAALFCAPGIWRSTTATIGAMARRRAAPH